MVLLDSLPQTLLVEVGVIGYGKGYVPYTLGKNLIPVAEASLWVSFSLHDYQGLLIVSRIPVCHSVLL